MKAYEQCQLMGNVGRNHDMPMQSLLEVETFDVWGIAFMGTFLISNSLYIFLYMWIMFQSG